MTRKDFVLLGDMIRQHNDMLVSATSPESFGPRQLNMLADFCASQNPRFDRASWLAYVRKGEV